MSREANLQKTQELYAAFGRGDIPAILGAMDADMTWINPGPSELASYFGTHRGPAAIAQNIFGFIGTELEFHAFEPHTFIADGDRVVALVRIDATMRKTGKRVEQECAHAWAFKDGRPIRFHDFQNNYAVVEALK